MFIIEVTVGGEVTLYHLLIQYNALQYDCIFISSGLQRYNISILPPHSLMHFVHQSNH